MRPAAGAQCKLFASHLRHFSLRPVGRTHARQAHACWKCAGLLRDNGLNICPRLACFQKKCISLHPGAWNKPRCCITCTRVCMCKILSECEKLFTIVFDLKKIPLFFPWIRILPQRPQRALRADKGGVDSYESNLLSQILENNLFSMRQIHPFYCHRMKKILFSSQGLFFES